MSDRKSASGSSGLPPLGAQVLRFPCDAHAVRALSRRLPQFSNAELEAKARAFCAARWPGDDPRSPEAA